MTLKKFVKGDFWEVLDKVIVLSEDTEFNYFLFFMGFV
jgi:hypothetical protein